MSVLCSLVGASFTVATAATVLRSKKGITAVGNAQIDTAQSQFSGASALFDGTGDYLDATPFSQSAGDTFTFECWVRFAATPSSGTLAMLISSSSSSNRYLGLNNVSGTLNWEIGHEGSAGTFYRRWIATVSTNTWYHIAYTKNGTTGRLFVNGTLLTAAQDFGTLDASEGIFSTTMRLGAWNNTANALNGHMDEIRISNNERYTTGFTAPTAAFVNDANTLLLIHANGTDASTFFEDDTGVRASNGLSQQNTATISTTQSYFGGSSLSLNGSSSVTTPTVFAFGTGNFTVEYWVRSTTLSGYDIHWDLRGGPTSNLSPIVYTLNGVLTMDVGATTVITGGTLSTNTWYHIALSRSGSSTKMFINGTQTGSTYTDTNNYIAATPLYIGTSGSNGVDGFMDEFRISNSARYTANFSSSSTAFVNDANTLLLCHFDGTNASTVFLDDNSGVPTVAPTTAVAFDGTGDYYSATGLTTSATDSKYLLFVCTFFWAGGTNLQHIADLRLGTGGSDVGFYSWINGGRSQITLIQGGSEVKTMYEDAENSLTSNAYNQIVFFMQTDSTANSKIFVNGRSRAFTNSSQTLVTLNWGNTATTITVGQKQAAITGTGADFNGRISQLYIHNSATAPDINSFWYFGSNRPMDLGTNGTATGLAQPLIYHYGNTTTFTANNGTGFNAYTLTANGNVATGDGPNYA